MNDFPKSNSIHQLQIPTQQTHFNIFPNSSIHKNFTDILPLQLNPLLLHHPVKVPLNVNFSRSLLAMHSPMGPLPVHIRPTLPLLAMHIPTQAPMPVHIRPTLPLLAMHIPTQAPMPVHIRPTLPLLAKLIPTQAPMPVHIRPTPTFLAHRINIRRTPILLLHLRLFHRETFMALSAALRKLWTVMGLL